MCPSSMACPSHRLRAQHPQSLALSETFLAFVRLWFTFSSLTSFRAVFEVFSSHLCLEFLKACSPTVPKTCAPLEPQHHVHMNQKTASLFLASFSLVRISLVFSLSIVILLSFLPCFFNSSSVFPDVLSLAGRKRYLTTYPWQKDIWYGEILSRSSVWRNN